MTEPKREEASWAAACHLAAMAVVLSIPFGNVLGPLIVWLLKRRDSEFVDRHGKEAVNFQITLTIVAAALLSLAIPSVFDLGFGPGPVFGGLGFLFAVLLAVMLYGFVMMVRAASRAGDGQDFSYPFTLRLIH